MLLRIYLLLIGFLLNGVFGDDISKSLFKKLASGYSNLVRPVHNDSETVNVSVGLEISRIIDMDEKNQVLTINAWFTQIWKDYRLSWNPMEFGNITIFYLPAEDIWIPEIVLYNTANGEYEPTMKTKATLHPDGTVLWRSPAIFKSSCMIDVEYFPFDEQICHVKFSSWTYDGYHVVLKHINGNESDTTIPKGIDMTNFTMNDEWDVMDVVSNVDNKYNNNAFKELKPYIQFTMTLRRKTIFYTVNLIIPCVSMSFLTVIVFALPSESGEKVTLCISILLALTLFFLLLVDIMPPTSLVIPLFGRYLVFTITMVTLSIAATIYVLNIHHRSPKSHRPMPRIVRKIFLVFLGKFLFKNTIDGKFGTFNKIDDNSTNFDFFIKNSNMYSIAEEEQSLLLNDLQEATIKFRSTLKHNSLLVTNIKKIFRIADLIKQEANKKRVMEEWKYLAMVIDRMLFYVFLVAFLFGTFYIFMDHPRLFDFRRPIQ